MPRLMTPSFIFGLKTTLLIIRHLLLVISYIFFDFHSLLILHNAIFRNRFQRNPSVLNVHTWYCNVSETLLCKLVYQFTVFGGHGRYIGNIIIFGDELFTDGVCVCQGRPTLQIKPVVGCQLLDWNCLTHGFPRPSFGTKLLGGESNVTFVKR